MTGMTARHGAADDLDIESIEAFPISLELRAGPVLAIGQAVKRDAVIVKVTTRGGLTGFGESHHGRAANIVAAMVNTTLKSIVLPASAADTVSIWQQIYAAQLQSHGLGAAVVLAMSGLDMALWDVRAKAVGWPLYRLLGGTRREIPAYAGGVALGWQTPPSLVREVEDLVKIGFRAVKLRVGDAPDRDAQRVAAVRERFGPELTIMVDANTGYSLRDFLAVLPAFESAGLEWIEEPFAPHDYTSYQRAASATRIRLAGGENLYTRFEFARALRDGHLGELQPDVAKVGGVTEFMRVAAIASAFGLQISPHSSVTGLSQAATLHVLSAVDNAGYFEADVTPEPEFRTELTSLPWEVSASGTVCAPDLPGLGVLVDEEFIAAHPFVPGSNFIKRPEPSRQGHTVDELPRTERLTWMR